MQNDRQQARAEVLRAVELDAELVEARRLLAKVHALLGEHELAIEEARRVLRQRARRPRDAHRAGAEPGVPRASSTKRASELDSIPLDQRGAEVNYALGRIDMLQGKSEAAREKLLAALERSPSTPRSSSRCSRTELALGKIDESLARIEKAAGDKPSDANLQRLLRHRADGLGAGAGRRGEAATARSSSIRTTWPRYQALARYLLGSNRVQEAIATYESARAEAAQLGAAALHARHALRRSAASATTRCRTTRRRSGSTRTWR